MKWVRKKQQIITKHGLGSLNKCVTGTMLSLTALPVRKQTEEWSKDEHLMYNQEQQNIYTHDFVLHRNIRCMFFWTAPEKAQTCATEEGRGSQYIHASSTWCEKKKRCPRQNENIARECVVEHKLMTKAPEMAIYLQKWDAGITVVRTFNIQHATFNIRCVLAWRNLAALMPQI